MATAGSTPADCENRSTARMMSSTNQKLVDVAVAGTEGICCTKAILAPEVDVSTGAITTLQQSKS